LQNGQSDLKQGQDELLRLISQLLPAKVHVETLEAVAQSVDSFGVSSSSYAMGYGDEDDPAVWRDFRLKALSEGVTSRDLEAYQEPLHNVLRSSSARRHWSWPLDCREAVVATTTEVSCSLASTNCQRGTMIGLRADGGSPARWTALSCCIACMMHGLQV
jgi:hypothetical protein